MVEEEGEVQVTGRRREGGGRARKSESKQMQKQVVRGGTKIRIVCSPEVMSLLPRSHEPPNYCVYCVDTREVYGEERGEREEETVECDDSTFETMFVSMVEKCLKWDAVPIEKVGVM